MTANQFRAALSRLDLTQVGAARLFGVGDRTIRRWSEDGVTGTAEIVLALLLAGKITLDDVRSAGQHPQKHGRNPRRQKITVMDQVLKNGMVGEVGVAQSSHSNDLPQSAGENVALSRLGFLSASPAEIRRALNAALRSEPPEARAQGEAMSATLAAYVRAPTDGMRALVMADLEAFEQARSGQ